MDTTRPPTKAAVSALRLSMIALLVLAALFTAAQPAAAQSDPDTLPPNRLYLPQVAGGSAEAQTQQPVVNPPANPPAVQAITSIPSNFFTVIDSGGANDVNSGQADLTQMGRDDANSSYYELFWSWDATDFAGQRGTACALFDTDNDSNINYAVCAEIENVPSGDLSVVKQTSTSPIAVTCGDDKKDRCSNPSNPLPFTPSQIQSGDLASLAASPPANLLTETDPFANLNPDQNWPNDSTIRLRILKSFLPANAVLANVCSYSSIGSGGNANPFDCVVTPGGGFLKIVKVAPSGATQTFNFTVNPGSIAKSIAGSGTTGAFPVPIGTGYSVVETIPTGWKLDTAVCALESGTQTGTKSGSSVTGITVQSGKITTCTFTNSLLENPPSIDVTKTANPTSIAEPGGSVTFQVDIKNTSDATDPVTITSLTDNVHGNLSGKGTCAVPVTIQPGATYSCSFSANVLGNPGYIETDTVTANGADNEGVTVSDSDDAAVEITDVKGTITVVKTANPTAVFEPGGDVTFSFVVNNTSSVDSVTIDTLSDSVYGDLDGLGTCDVPQTIAAGGKYECAITVLVEGNAGSTHTNVVTASGTDDDGKPVSDTDDATVTINDVPSSMEVVKTANPSTVQEPGGDVLFTIEVKNTSEVDDLTLTGLSDTVFGDLLDALGACELPKTIAPDASYFCSFTVKITGNAGFVHANTVTATANDDDGNTLTGSDDATVTVLNVPSEIQLLKTADPETVDEPGGEVTFTFVVNNLSTVDPVMINELSDTVYGDLTQYPGSTCTVGQVLDPGSSYDCTIAAYVSGNAGEVHKNIATAKGVDDDGQLVSDDDSATVTLNNVQGAIEVVKTASPTVVKEPGGDVEYTIIVYNLSTIDAVQLTSLIDDRFGNLAGQGDCAVGQWIAPSGSYTCTFTRTISGNPGDEHVNVVTASGVDDDGDGVSDTDDETVTVDDVPSSIELVKTASAGSIDEPGGEITFSFEVKNTSAVDTVTITSLTDSVYDDLTAVPGSTCVMPQTIPAGQSYTCSITVFVGGNYRDSHTNVATASGKDDDGSDVTASDDETVLITDTPSSIKVTKSASPSTVPETGGNVHFTVVVENTSLVDHVTINSVTDSVLDVVSDISGYCTPALPADLAPGATVTCAFREFISGEAGQSHVDVAVGSGTDDDGGPVTGDDDLEVPFTDVKPDITVTKTAAPTAVPETGGDVTFTFVVTNNSTEAGTITKLEDSSFGPLNGGVGCAVNTVLAPHTSCTFDATFPIPAGDYPGSHSNTFTAVVSDNDGNTDTATDDETVDYTDVKPSVTVEKTASPTAVPETGGDVTFMFLVTNLSSENATITSLEDTVFGKLDSADPVCKVGAVLAPNASCSFSITQWIAGDAAGDDHVNVFTAVVSDDDDNSASASDDATVDFTDVAPDISVTKTANPTAVPETGGNVTFKFEVKNHSAEAVTITSLTDDKFGASGLPGDADCQVGTKLAAGASCDFTATFTVPAGDYPGSHVNTFTAVAADNEGTTDTATDNETVTYTDVKPDITVTKTANPTSVPETGGSVAFTFSVKNNSAEAAKITSLSDDKFGALAGDADCKKDTVLAAGASCDFTATFTVPAGNAGGSHINTFTAVASDDDGNTDTESAGATVTYTDVSPAVAIVKTVDANSDGVFNDAENLLNANGMATYKYQVTNTSPAGALDPLTVDTLVDNRGTADAADDMLLVSGGVLQAGVTLVKSGGDQDDLLETGETWTYTWTVLVPISAAAPTNTNTATVTAHDDESTSATASDTATVRFLDFGQIAPTGTTCEQYVGGTATDFDVYYAYQGGVIQYGVKSNKINQTNPGVFFYYTGLSKTLAGSGARTVYIDQSDDSALVRAFTATKNDVKLWRVTGTTCTQVQLQSSQITLGSGANAGDVTVSFTASAPAGSYYVVSVKYDTAAVVGVNLGAARPTVKYTFTTDVGKNGSIEETDIKGITLAPK